MIRRRGRERLPSAPEFALASTAGRPATSGATEATAEERALQEEGGQGSGQFLGL